MKEQISKQKKKILGKTEQMCHNRNVTICDIFSESLTKETTGLFSLPLALPVPVPLLSPGADFDPDADFVYGR